MGFLEKVKNMFTEEVVDDDVKVEQVTKEVTQVKVNTKEEEEDIVTSEIEKFHFDDDTNKPVFFDDNAFNDMSLNDEKIFEEKKEVEEIETPYKVNRNIEEVTEKKVFKPTPIISPVYGVLDKNYHKEDIVSRNDNKKTNNKKNMPVEEITIDSIRDKAYGTLEDELENTLFGSNSILFKKDESKKEKIEEKPNPDKKDIISNLTDDISKELDELLIKKDTYKEDKDINKDDLNDDDLLGFIDSTLYKNGDDE